ncbi:MAG TPA: NCS1 family nucleobase:cation symporter-1 [Nevskiaceae bacterium]|nr:NCS1 family nucleobase:cation symporter-1 [Nevskiaceae bacterium]
MSAEVESLGTAALAELDPSGRLYNADLAPAAPGDRRWNAYSLFSVWMNDAHNVGDYTFAAGLFIAGMSAIDITVGILIGACIICVGCCWSGFIGLKTGTPYPVLSRMSWGIWGANIPALVRGIVAIGWYGIQTYLASVALKLLMLRFIPGMMTLTTMHFAGLDLAGWIAFLVLSAIQLAVVWRGMEAVRHFQGASGPILWIFMLILAVWMLWQAHWDISWTTGGGHVALSLGQSLHHILVAAALTVGTLATLMLNFADFARYAPNRRAVIVGNLWGLPVNWTAFALTSVVVSAASAKVYGAAVLDPAELLKKVNNDVLFLVGTFMFVLATVGVNIVANYVSPAFDISNINPRRISFRVAGIVTAILSIVVTPWNLFSSPAVIAYFLGGLGALLGPFFGILVVDFFLVRHQRFSQRDLFMPNAFSIYYYHNGYNGLAAKAFVPAAIVALVVALVPALKSVAPFGWFIGAPLAAIIYYVIAKGRVPLVPSGETPTSLQGAAARGSGAGA